MNDVRMNELLSEMRTMAAKARGAGLPLNEARVGEAESGFGALLRQSIERVNSTQQEATKLAEAFERGDANVDVAAVMVSMQKASLAFQGMTQVRNKLVSAYQEIMSMQV
jgi:flagellar hook-basal body complex protein FliE